MRLVLHVRFEGGETPLARATLLLSCVFESILSADGALLSELELELEVRRYPQLFAKSEYY
jgi:hypothetical protein